LTEHEQSVLNAEYACSHELPQRSLAAYAVVVEQPQRLRECQFQPGHLLEFSPDATLKIQIARLVRRGLLQDG
jgi:hypothetical protein